MAITALKTGCKLPIRIHGKYKKEIPRFIPDELMRVTCVSSVLTPMPRIIEDTPYEQPKEESPPKVYDVY